MSKRKRHASDKEWNSTPSRWCPTRVSIAVCLTSYNHPSDFYTWGLAPRPHYGTFAHTLPDSTPFVKFLYSPQCGLHYIGAKSQTLAGPGPYICWTRTAAERSHNLPTWRTVYTRDSSRLLLLQNEAFLPKKIVPTSFSIVLSAGNLWHLSAWDIVTSVGLYAVYVLWKYFDKIVRLSID